MPVRRIAPTNSSQDGGGGLALDRRGDGHEVGVGELDNEQWRSIQPLLPPRARMGYPIAGAKRPLNGTSAASLRAAARWTSLEGTAPQDRLAGLLGTGYRAEQRSLGGGDLRHHSMIRTVDDEREPRTLAALSDALLSKPIRREIR